MYILKATIQELFDLEFEGENRKECIEQLEDFIANANFDFTSDAEYKIVKTTFINEN